jgi:hypothetical protein
MNIFNLYKNYIIQNKQTTPPGPVGWKGLCFEALDDTNIYYSNVESNTVDLKYSINGIEWINWNPDTPISISPNGNVKKVYVKGHNPNGFCQDKYEFTCFKSDVSNSIKVSGNINSLISDDDGTKVTSINNYCYCLLFSNMTALVDASELELSIDTLSNYCYYSIFKNCTSLIASPILPATTLAADCYSNMFYGCSSLVTAPALPATTLAPGCYESMFHSCSSLVNAPTLPATTLSNSCYSSMFQSCTSLTTAPELPATTLVYRCYWFMFNECRSLINVDVLPATALVESCYIGMFTNCKSLIQAPEIKATNIVSGSCGSMFYGCSKLSYIKIDYTGDFSSGYFSSWVSGVAQSGDFYYNGNDTTRGSNAIPEGWAVHTF